MTKKWRNLFDLFVFSLVISFLLIISVVLFSGFPLKADDIFLNSLIESVRPGYFKTYDLRNYLIGIVIFSLFPVLTYRFKLHEKFSSIRKKYKKKLIFLFSILSIIVIVISIFIISYKLPLLLHSWESLKSKQRTKDLLNHLIYPPLILGLFVYSYFVLKNKMIEKYIKNLLAVIKYVKTITNRFRQVKLHPILINFLVFSFIFLMVFNPRYKYSYEKIANYPPQAVHQFHHSNFYIGPINEVLQGKTLLVNTKTQYGILTTYVLTLLFQLTSFSYSSFTLYVMLLAFIYVSFLFVFLKHITKSNWWAFIGILIFLKFVYFGRNWPHEIYTLPSTTPLRYIFDVPILFAIYSLYKKNDTLNSYLVAAIVSVAFFYNLEIGFSLLLAYLGTITLDLIIALNKLGRKIENVKKPLTNFFQLFIILAVCFLTLTIFTFVRSGQLPNWYLFFEYIVFYGKGFFDIPMPIIGAYYFPLFIYIVTFYIVFYKFLNKNYEQIHLLFFLLLYGLISFVYYLGLNELNHLMTIIHPSLILSIIFLQWLWKNHKYFKDLNILNKSILTTSVIAVIIFLTWDPIRLFNDVSARFRSRYSLVNRSYYLWSYHATDIYISDNNGQDFFRAADNIKKYSAGKRALIISRYDTLLEAMSQKASWLDYSIIEGINYQSELDREINAIKQGKPEYVFVYSQKYKSSPEVIITLWNQIKEDYVFLKHAGVIDVYQLK